MNVLIVEDQRSISDFLQEAFALWGHQVDGCRTAQEALEKVRGTRYDLALLDLFLPEGVMGHELIPDLKAWNPDLGIVTMTGHNSRELELEVRKQGVFCYLIKPFSLMVLKELIDHISRMKRTTEGSHDPVESQRIKCPSF